MVNTSLTCVTAAGNTKQYGPGLSPEFRRSPEFRAWAWVRTTLLDVNRIIFIQAGWAYRTNKVEVLVPAYSLHYGPAQ